MGRKTWVKPMTLVQQFEANEAVAAEQCYGVACVSKTEYKTPVWESIIDESPHGWHWERNNGSGDGLNGGLKSDLPGGCHHRGACSHAENNIFRIDGMNVVFVEENQSGNALDGGWDDSLDLNNNGVIDKGDVIYWHTTKDTYRYNHYGYVDALDPSRPLHS